MLIVVTHLLQMSHIQLTFLALFNGQMSRLNGIKYQRTDLMFRQNKLYWELPFHDGLWTDPTQQMLADHHMCWWSFIFKNYFMYVYSIFSSKLLHDDTTVVTSRQYTCMSNLSLIYTRVSINLLAKFNSKRCQFHCISRCRQTEGAINLLLCK